MDAPLDELAWRVAHARVHMDAEAAQRAAWRARRRVVIVVVFRVIRVGAAGHAVDRASAASVHREPSEVGPRLRERRRGQLDGVRRLAAKRRVSTRSHPTRAHTHRTTAARARDVGDNESVAPRAMWQSEGGVRSSGVR